MVLATGRPYLCDSLCLYLSTQEIDVVGTADSVASLLALALRVKPDLVVLDEDLANPHLELTMDALAAGDRPPAVVLLHALDAPTPPAAARAAGRGKIGDPPDVLLALMHEAGQRAAAARPRRDHPA